MPALLNTSKHMQYPPNQHNWATDSVCCTVKECGRSRVQHTARIATVTHQLTPPPSLPLSLSLFQSLSLSLFLFPSLPVVSSFPHLYRESFYRHIYISFLSSLSLSLFPLVSLLSSPLLSPLSPL